MSVVPRFASPGKVDYCCLMSIPMLVVAFSVKLSDPMLYPSYSYSPRSWHMAPMFDQAAGGLSMCVPGSLFFLIVLSVVFFKWQAADSDSSEGAQVQWTPAHQAVPPVDR
mgnify:CR=1 FL=1